MPNVTKPGEGIFPWPAQKALLRQVKAIAAARGETMRDWLERAARNQIALDLNGQAAPVPSRPRAR